MNPSTSRQRNSVRPRACGSAATRFLSLQIAGKKALQDAAAKLALRILPLIVT